MAGRAEPHGMDAHARLAARVAAEQDELLTTLLLCGDDAAVAERLWSQLVDLLVESLFLDLRGAFLAGAIDRATYLRETTATAHRCRQVGLLPLPASGTSDPGSGR